MKFICDHTLGKLTKYLRILGFDTASITSLDILNKYKRLANPPLLFTKMLKSISYQPIVFIRTNNIQEQIKEIGDIIRPYNNDKNFMTRCIECNVLLECVQKEDIEPLVPEYVYHHHEEFKACPSCKKVYWEGTHTEQMKKWTGVLKTLE
jgi:hypothetical protein